MHATLIVGIRARPMMDIEAAKINVKNILRILDDKVVTVLDPDETKDYLDQIANRSKEKQYTFDYAFDIKSKNKDIYDGMIKGIVSGIMKGLNGTVFAYGATGSGKTHTMVGTLEDPGLMILSLEQIFSEKEKYTTDQNISISCSYVEVYNEVIYDLLVKNSGGLELREDPSHGAHIAGLKRIQVEDAKHIMDLLEEGNKRRKTENTDANDVSSRSHAVFEIVVERSNKNHYKKEMVRGKLCLVDLAGSERAAETNNIGQKLRDGANINRSLLALANCINALGKKQKRGMAYVPYRNSKLTRLLKDGLSGNSRTAMVATVSSSSDQYHHSINTLKYANRAKEIKTHLVQNVGTIERHVSDYRHIIDNLQNEVQVLKSQLEVKPPNSTDQLSWVNSLATEINENVEERINLQKALFELEDINVCNKFELKNLDEILSSLDVFSEEREVLLERRRDILDNIRENEEAGARYKEEIKSNESMKKQIQEKIDQGISQYQNASFLTILSTFRLQAVRLQEMQFQMAIRDQIISEQRNVISNLWNVMECSGLDKNTIMEIAQAEEDLGILMERYLREGKTATTAAAADLSENSKCDYSQSNHEASDNIVKRWSPSVRQSISGEMANFRYRFWSNYEEDSFREYTYKDRIYTPLSGNTVTGLTEARKNVTNMKIMENDGRDMSRQDLTPSDYEMEKKTNNQKKQNYTLPAISSSEKPNGTILEEEKRRIKLSNLKSFTRSSRASSRNGTATTSS